MIWSQEIATCKENPEDQIFPTMHLGRLNPQLAKNAQSVKKNAISFDTPLAS